MFKVGDIVIGNELASKYYTTTRGTIWRVSLVNDNTIRLVGVEKPHQQEPFVVDAQRFDLYKDGKGVKIKLPKYTPMYPEVFVYKNGNTTDGLTAVDAISGKHIDDLDDVILFNATFKKMHGKRGILGIPSYNYNKHVQGMHSNYYFEDNLEYRSSKFIKPHYTNKPGQPTRVMFMHLKNGKMLWAGKEFLGNNILKQYVETKLYTPPAKPLIERGSAETELIDRLVERLVDIQTEG